MAHPPVFPQSQIFVEFCQNLDSLSFSTIENSYMNFLSVPLLYSALKGSNKGMESAPSQAFSASKRPCHIVLRM